MNFHRNPITHVGQVHLKVKDLSRSVAFYEQVVGFQVYSRTGTTADLTADGKTVLLTLEQPDGVTGKQGRTTGLYHFALLLPTRSDLAQFVVHLSDLNLSVGSADHLVSEALYFSDPDGNGIEVYRDREPSEWTWNGSEVAMTTDPLNFRDLLAGVNERTWKGLPAGTMMGHIHLHVSDLQETERFYTQGLGFEVVCRYGGQALFISSGKYHHHIGLNTWNGAGAPRPAANSAGLESFDVVYPNEEARSRAVANVRNLGAAVAQAAEGLSVDDPSGNRIRLLVGVE